MQDNQAAEEVAQKNQAELGSLVTCLMLHLPGLEDGSLGEHLHRVVVDLGKKLVVDSSHSPAQVEGTGVGLMDLLDQSMVGVHMEEAWNHFPPCLLKMNWTKEQNLWKSLKTPVIRQRGNSESNDSE